MKATWGVYVHLPWCKRRCPYCAFYIEADHGPPWRRFLDAVGRDWQARRALFPLDAPRTVSLGGGTPSRLPPEHLAELLTPLRDGQTVECSAEVNPEDALEWVPAAVAAGVDRVSLGVQTFHPRHARLLNRTCSAPRALQVARAISEMGVRTWSVDLMFALPGQTIDELDHDLDRVLALEAPHVSLYGLTWEDGTPLARARDLGRLVAPPDDLWREMYDRCVVRLESAGLYRYEVSNFARPGHESAHNLLYWTGAPYLGLGPSAHGFAPDGGRWRDVADVDAWMAGAPPEIERPDPEDAAKDLLVGGLRGRDGLRAADLPERFGFAPDPALVRRLVAARLLADDPDRLRLGADGWPVADAVVRALAEGLRVSARARPSC